MADNRPPTLAEWRDIIINPTAPFCDQFKKIPRLHALIYQFFTWAFGSDGKTPTIDFLNALTGGTGVVPGVAPGQVQGVTASTGLAGYIYVSWSSMSSATLYYIYRSATDDFSTATQVGSTATLGFSEKDVAGGGTLVDGTTYYYWVKGWNNSGYGTQSASASGSCIVGSSSTQVNNIPGTYSIVVPAGMGHMTSYVRGGGGGGGKGDAVSGSGAWWPVIWVTDSSPAGGHWASSNPNVNATYGGGGGGGGYATTVNTVVVAGQTVTVVVGNGGNLGEAGIESYVSYAAAVVARATGGSPGGTHAGGAGGIKDVGDSGSSGSVGGQGTSSNGGAGGLAGNSAGLPAGQTTMGSGGIGGSSTFAGATPGQNGIVIVEFSA